MTRPPALLNSLVTRESLPIWLKERGLLGQAVEVGTFRGEFAVHWLTHWAGHLTTIDPFLPLDRSEYHDGCTNNDMGGDVLRDAQRRLHPWMARCRIIHARSLEVVHDFKHGSLDAVYLDGNHRGEIVAQEIAAWWPKIRQGGLLGGHDFYSRADDAQTADVANAVLDFAEQLGMRPRVTPCTSWWFVR